MGYAGGMQHAPTYRNLKDHSEAFEVYYNPDELSYEQLLAYVWDSHNPHYNTTRVQYHNVVWVADDEQRRIAEQQKAAIEEESGKPVATHIMPHTKFHAAEDYHQKYTLRRNQALMQLFDHWYPTGEGFRESFTAMRMNAFLQGHGSAPLLMAELDGYGLPDELKQALVEQSSHLSEDQGMACAIPGA